MRKDLIKNKIVGTLIAVAGLTTVFLCRDISIFLFTLMLSGTLFVARKNCITI